MKAVATELTIVQKMISSDLAASLQHSFKEACEITPGLTDI